RKLENSEEFSPSDSNKETSSSEESEISEDSEKSRKRLREDFSDEHQNTEDEL
ncbi:10844_t:CDS:2, partial [Scutellospora calospora]